LLPAEQGISSEIRKFPMLEPEQEYMLAKRWVEHGDTERRAPAGHSHLRLAAKIAMGYRGYGLPQAEVISEANVGLMQAVKRFDPRRASAWRPMPCGGSAPRSRNTSCARGAW
jgi:RNA polymerase sigma-32 factor